VPVGYASSPAMLKWGGFGWGISRSSNTATLLREVHKDYTPLAKRAMKIKPTSKQMLS